jgi:hypothetical protein
MTELGRLGEVANGRFGHEADIDLKMTTGRKRPITRPSTSRIAVPPAPTLILSGGVQIR